MNRKKATIQITNTFYKACLDSFLSRSMAGGSKKSHKDLLQKFKSKVISKLFGNREDTDTLPSDHSDDNNTAAGSSSSTLSGIDPECRAREVRLYGAQCCPTGSKHQNHVNEPVHRVGSSSYLSDDEDSDINSAPRKKKIKTNRSCSKALKQAQGTATSSSSGSSQTTDNQSQESHSAPLTKNQRRKLKKKRKEHEKKIKTRQSSEFVFDSSSNNNAYFSTNLVSQSKEEHLTSVKEFLEAIWDIYFYQNPEKASCSTEFENLIITLEQCESEDLLLLFNVMTTLVLSNKEKGQRKIEEFQQKTSLNNELKIFVTNLFSYWINNVMKS